MEANNRIEASALIDEFFGCDADNIDEEHDDGDDESDYDYRYSVDDCDR